MLAQETKSITTNVQNDNNVKEIQNLVFNQVRAIALILLNYRYGLTRCLGVNAAIIDHIRHWDFLSRCNIYTSSSSSLEGMHSSYPFDVDSTLLLLRFSS